MRIRLFSTALAAGLLSCSLGAKDAAAGTVMVTEDAGTFNFTLTANGSGNITVAYTGVNLTSVNYTDVGPFLSQLHGTGSESVDVTSTVSNPPLTTYTLSDEVPGVKTFGIGPGFTSSAALQYQITAGYAINPGFLNINGRIINVISPDLQATGSSTIYDFAAFANGGTMALTYNSVGVDFASIIANGGTVTGTGGFTEIASVPEPSSMALLGVGVTAMFAFRRYFKRASTA